MENYEGDFTILEPMPLNTEAKPIIYRINENGCHICISLATNDNGYIYCCRNKKRWSLHRYVYSILKGEIPAGLVVRHKCDDRRCINPEHLELGTQKDNVRDMIERGRQRYGHPLAAELIRAIYYDDRKIIEISRSYNINRHTVMNIKKLKSPKYIKALASTNNQAA